MLASIVADTAAGQTSFTPPVALIAGGETVVTVRGNGKGGRNSECALAAALCLDGVKHVAIGCLATDGDDANAGSPASLTVERSPLTLASRPARRSQTTIHGRFCTPRVPRSTPDQPART